MNKSIYIYQDNFISLLNLIKFLITNKIKPENIKPSNYTPTLLDHLIHLNLEENYKIITEWQAMTNKEIIKTSYYIFIAENDNKELIMYYFLLNALKYQEKIFYMRNLNCVVKALKISKHVSREVHRFKGFTRFKELKNHVLYAEIEPDNDILYLLSIHFQKRLKNEYWIMKDKKRQIISIYDKKKFYLVKNSEFTLSETSFCTQEEEFETLWKNFYKTIGITERKNERCRMNFMPKKYWKNMIEMSDEIEKNN